MSSGDSKANYLVRVLQMNPHVDAEAILTIRAKMFGLVDSSKKPKTDERLDERRQMLRNQIDELRSQFWTLQVQTLRSRLDALSVHKFPDMRATVDRLKLISLYRDQFNQLSKHRDKNINLLNTFKRVIMMPPRDAGRIKEKYLRKIAHSSSLPDMKRMVRTLKKNFPDLYNVESDWFREIERIKARDSISYEGGGGGGIEIPGWLIIFAVYFVIKLVVFIASVSR